MISNPEKMIPKFIKEGSDWISFHVEVTQKIPEIVKMIKMNKKKAGLVLNPDTAIEVLFPFLKEIDYVLLMSVFPGYGGQKFIEATLDKVIRLKKKINDIQANCLIQVDGGLKCGKYLKIKKGWY